MPTDPLPGTAVDYEKILVKRLVQTVSGPRSKSDANLKVNFYVSLKSKPLAILVGPNKSGKSELIKEFANSILNPPNHNQFQFMPGHPWWTERSENIQSFGYLHDQFVAEKIKFLIKNATQKKHENELFLACLNKISPAEVYIYFTEIARQLHRGRFIHLSDSFVSHPFIYPDNLLVVGSIDAKCFTHYNDELLTSTNIIHWQEVEKNLLKPAVHLDEINENAQVEFLKSRIQNAGSAHLKLQEILGDQSLALMPLLNIESVLIKHGQKLSTRQVTSEAVIYLANSWTQTGLGLFDCSHSENLKIALDFAIAQTILPRGWKMIQKSSKLQTSLKELLDFYPYSFGILEKFSHRW